MSSLPATRSERSLIMSMAARFGGDGAGWQGRGAGAARGGGGVATADDWRNPSGRPISPLEGIGAKIVLALSEICAFEAVRASDGARHGGFGAGFAGAAGQR